ncbi:MAG: EF-P lysine aminoacylase GenX, partial [Gammaproteobacteria bacterium]|nr:EF-P lysine aminoacylase GenX [Gammaproteobacteria bacterium]
MAYRLTAAFDTLRLRARMLARVREFFTERGLLEVETPALSPAAPTDPAIESIAAAVASLGRTHYLHTSPEFAMKRLLAAGSGDIWQLCRVWRDGEIGRWHQPEFTMLEWYRVGWDEERLMDEVEALLRHAAGADVAAWPAARVPYARAFEDATGVDPHRVLAEAAPRGAASARLASRLADAGIDVPRGLRGSALLDLAFGTLVQGALPRDALTFVHDYPLAQAALARSKGGTPPVAARFELFGGGLELANGFAELTDPAEQRRRFEADQAEREAAGLPIRPIDEPFLA